MRKICAYENAWQEEDNERRSSLFITRTNNNNKLITISTSVSLYSGILSGTGNQMLIRPVDSQNVTGMTCDIVKWCIRTADIPHFDSSVKAWWHKQSLVARWPVHVRNNWIVTTESLFNHWIFCRQLDSRETYHIPLLRKSHNRMMESIEAVSIKLETGLIVNLLCALFALIEATIPPNSMSQRIIDWSHEAVIAWFLLVGCHPTSITASRWDWSVMRGTWKMRIKRTEHVLPTHLCDKSCLLFFACNVLLCFKIRVVWFHLPDFQTFIKPARKNERAAFLRCHTLDRALVST